MCQEPGLETNLTNIPKFSSKFYFGPILLILWFFFFTVEKIYNIYD